jgi:ubiquinone/menaquinone biosynthesis C-methylase UbiE
MTLELDDFKARQRAAWSSGDYDVFGDQIADVGELVADRAEARPGTRLLDVACGTGNASIPAAHAGAQVTGLDLSPYLLAAAQAKAEAESLRIDWVEGDLEALPFEDGSFDRVVSTFGHMFAPRHQVVADEMVRVCTKGGALVTATWTPESWAAAINRLSSSFLPPPPDYASPPLQWGTEEYVRERFAPVAKDLAFERHVNWVVAESVEAWADLFLDRFPPMLGMRAILGDRFGEFREQAVQAWRDANEADDGTLRFPQEYLLSIVRL